MIPEGFEQAEMVVLSAGSATLRIVGADDRLVGAGEHFVAAWREGGQTKTAIAWWEGPGTAGMAQGIAGILAAVAGYGRSIGWSNDDVQGFLFAVFALAHESLAHESIEVGGGGLG